MVGQKREKSGQRGKEVEKGEITAGDHNEAITKQENKNSRGKSWRATGNRNCWAPEKKQI